MHDKPVALVTGANQGIGLQIAKELVDHDFTVLVGSRDVGRGEAAAREIGPDAHALQLDVRDQPSITQAAERVSQEFGRLDVLIQNAAISNTNWKPGQSLAAHAAENRPSNVSLDEVRTVWDTNVFGVLAVYQAMLPILRRTPNARIVNVSSGLGSLTVSSDPEAPYRSIFSPVYPASKTALNALTVAMAIELEPEGSRLMRSRRATPRRTSTASWGRTRLKRVLARLSVSLCSALEVPPAASPSGRTKQFLGDPATPRPSNGDEPVGPKWRVSQGASRRNVLYRPADTPADALLRAWTETLGAAMSVRDLDRVPWVRLAP